MSDNGKVYARQPGIAHDELIGRVDGQGPEPLVLAGGAAFFLLLGGLEEG